jgi:hypothetical protein
MTQARGITRKNDYTGCLWRQSQHAELSVSKDASASCQHALPHENITAHKAETKNHPTQSVDNVPSRRFFLRAVLNREYPAKVAVDRLH